jgi:G:T/U-mismatch repair DNA glycosylase
MTEKNIHIEASRARADMKSRRDTINNATSHRQAGTTTGEFMFWGILTALVVLGSIVAYVLNNSTQQSQDLVKDYNSAAAKSSQLFSGNWANFTTVNADNAGVFKQYSAFIDNGGGNVIALPGNGTVSVAPGTLSTANDSGQWTITQLGQNDCATFVSGIQRTAGSVTVNGNSVKAYQGTFQPQSMQCKDTNNTVVVVRS